MHTITATAFSFSIQGTPIPQTPAVTPNPYVYLYLGTPVLGLLKRTNNTMAIFRVQVGYYSGGSLVTYKDWNLYTDSAGEVMIQFGEVLRAIATKAGLYAATEIYIRMYAVNAPSVVVDSLYVYPSLYEGIDYDDMMAPRLKDIAGFQSPALILPPNVIWNRPTTTDNGDPVVSIETNIITKEGTLLYAVQEGGGLAQQITPTGARSAQIETTRAAVKLLLQQSTTTIREWNLERPSTCSDVICVQWTSKTGVVRRHYFPVVSWIEGSDSRQGLTAASDGFRVAKNTYRAARCRITGLTSYSFWYYMDLLGASDVHAILPGLSQDINGPLSEAIVDTDYGETPMGSECNTFEFTIRLKRHDLF